MILSLATGWTLEQIRRLPDKDYQRYRRFYLKCPFGPARGDIQAWLTAQHVWAGWHGKTKPMLESIVWFGGKKQRAKPKVNPQRGRVGRAFVERLQAIEKETGRQQVVIMRAGDGKN